MTGHLTMIDYSKAAETYDHTRSHSEAVIDRFHAVVGLDETTAVLDFGCGTGNYLLRIRERFGSRCCGVEPSDEMRSRAQAKSGEIQILKGDHGAISFPAGTFDFAFMTDVIHHVPDLPAMFAELHRVLKPGGRLCVVTQSHAQIERRFYNRYFASLADIEKRRYPDINVIVAAATTAGLHLLAEETSVGASREVNDAFIRNVCEKNWSMLRLLGDAEFQAGLSALRLDRGKSFTASGAGDTSVWFQRKAV